jgi:tripartite-type tricarboxylate transporter receptor subunit TctC
VENRPGANGNIGTEAVVRASPDGYTLLMVGGWSAINATLYDKLSFNFSRDIAPVAGIVRALNVMVTNPSFPAKAVPEFIAYVKANPGKLNMASGGVGGPSHVWGELFNMMAGVNMIHVPYRGLAPALTELLGGQVQVIFSSLPAATEYIKADRLRALAVTTATRSELLPDIPTISEFLPGYEASQWYGVGVAKNAPTEIINTLNKEINAGLVDTKMKARLADLGGTVLPGSPADFGKLVADETEKWGNVIRALNIKAD